MAKYFINSWLHGEFIFQVDVSPYDIVTVGSFCTVWIIFYGIIYDSLGPETKIPSNVTLAFL